eukprot:scaffold40010_cov58-Phaeocystis_antarctica.AAC.2
MGVGSGAEGGGAPVGLCRERRSKGCSSLYVVRHDQLGLQRAAGEVSGRGVDHRAPIDLVGPSIRIERRGRRRGGGRRGTPRYR